MLTITQDLIRDLAAKSTDRPDEVGIVLTAEGWQIWSLGAGNRFPTGLVAMTLEDVHYWMDEAGGLTDDLVQALAATEDYRIPDENGKTTPPAGAEWVVVTGTAPLEGEPGDESAADWRSAFWVDLSQATELVEAPTGALRSGRAVSLWRTDAGTLLVRTESLHISEPELSWQVAPLGLAAQHTYRADPELIVGELPPALAAAAHAKRTVAALALPDIITGQSLWPLRDELADTLRACRIISDLIRQTALADIRDIRTHAAHLLVSTYDNDRSAAADAAGMAYQTLAHLL